MGDIIEMDKIKTIFANYDKLNEAVTTLGLGIIGTSGTYYKIAFMNEKGVVGIKKEGYLDIMGNKVNAIRIRVIFWSIQMEKEQTGDYSKLENIGWEPKGDNHVSIVVKTEDEMNIRLQEAIDFMEEN
jgi:hypothetical protein